MVNILPTQLIRSCDNGFFICLGEWAYTVSNGYFWAAALLGFAIVLFIATQKFGTARSFGFSSIIMFFGAVIFQQLGFLSNGITALYIIIGGIGIVVMIMSER